MIPVLDTITAIAKMIGLALGLVSKGQDRKAGVDAQRAKEGDATLKIQQEVTDAAAAMDTRDARDVDPAGWLRGPRSGGVSGQAHPPTPAAPADVHQPTERRRGSVDS